MSERELPPLTPAQRSAQMRHLKFWLRRLMTQLADERRRSAAEHRKTAAADMRAAAELRREAAK